MGTAGLPRQPDTNRCQRVRRWLAVLLAVPVLLFAAPGAAAEGTVRLSTGDWPPYFDSTADDQGLLAHIIREAFQRADIEVKYTFLPWSRALAVARQGSVDGSAAWSCTDDRARAFHFSDPLLPLHYVFFHRKDLNFHWQALEDLRGLTVGVTQDYAYGPQLATAQALGLVRTDTTASDESNLRKLLAGRIDLFPLDPLTGAALIERLFPEPEGQQLTYHPFPLRRASYHLIFPRELERSAELQEAFNRGLASLQHSGRLEQILEDSLQASGLDHNLSQLLTQPPPASPCTDAPPPPRS